MTDKEEMEDERALTMSAYRVAFPAFSSLPFTTELANELANKSNSRVTGVVFVHGMGTRCTLDSGVSSWCTLSLPLAPLASCKSVEAFRIVSGSASASGSLAPESSGSGGVYGRPSEEGCVEVVLHSLSAPRSIVSISSPTTAASGADRPLAH